MAPRRRSGGDDSKALFSMALGLVPPWKVVEVQFSPREKQLDLWVDFERGATFACPRCNAEGAKGYDTAEKTWRHLNFFEHRTYLHAWVPRVECPQCKAITQVEVPWSRPGSGFTLLFEAMIVAMAREMPVNALAKMVGEHDTRLWRVIRHHVGQAVERQNLSEVRRVGMDETASRRWHHYITLFLDLERARMIFGTSGKDKGTVATFAAHLAKHGGDPEAIEEVTCDMSPAYIHGTQEHLPNARVTLDRFHIMKLANDGVDEVRREEVKTNPLLKKTRYLWLKNPSGLKAWQSQQLESLRQHHLKTARAYQMKLSLQDFFEQPDRATGEAFLKRWYFWATHSRLDPMIRVAKTLRNHQEAILAWFEHQLTNAMLEGMNSLLQAAKARARGYRSDANFLAIAYLIAGKLQFQLPTHSW